MEFLKEFATFENVRKKSELHFVSQNFNNIREMIKKIIATTGNRPHARLSKIFL